LLNSLRIPLSAVFSIGASSAAAARGRPLLEELLELLELRLRQNLVEAAFHFLFKACNLGLLLGGQIQRVADERRQYMPDGRPTAAAGRRPLLVVAVDVGERALPIGLTKLGNAPLPAAGRLPSAASPLLSARPISVAARLLGGRYRDCRRSQHGRSRHHHQTLQFAAHGCPLTLHPFERRVRVSRRVQQNSGRSPPAAPPELYRGEPEVKVKAPKFFP
jgi:hypothetical protein